MERKVIPLILAGGKGSRFWPLSRKDFPKQFLCLDGKDSLLQKTMIRAKKVAFNAFPYVIALDEQYSLVLSSLLEKEGEDYHFIGEPMGKNTAAAIYYGCCRIKELEGDATIVVLPADHYIEDHEAFVSDIKNAASLAAKKEKIVLLGVRPTFPETGFGYAVAGKRHATPCFEYYSLRKFVEKPQKDHVKRYLKRDDCFWNTGMFIFSLGIIENLYEKYLPALKKHINENISFDNVYRDVESISFDKGILERESSVYLIKASFKWDDVGSYRGLASVLPEDRDGNVCRGNQLIKESEKSVVLTDNRLTVLYGVKNIIVAENDGVLLICSKDKAKDVGMITSLLDGNNLIYQ